MGGNRWERVAGGSEWDCEGVGGSRWQRVATGSEWDWDREVHGIGRERVGEGGMVGASGT